MQVSDFVQCLAKLAEGSAVQKQPIFLHIALRSDGQSCTSEPGERLQFALRNDQYLTVQPRILSSVAWDLGIQL